MMKIIASLFILVSLVAVVLYFKPTSSASEMFNSALHESNSSQPDTSSLHSQLKEPAQSKNVSLNSTQPKPVSADTVPLYDTKSDLSIQPIDPEKDPANEIKTL